MGYFLNKLELEVRGFRDFVVIKPFHYKANNGVVYTVPMGQETDLASVWNIPFASLFLAGRGNKAAVVHDYLYRTGKVSRKTADLIFKEALRSQGESRLIAWTMYIGVRLGGWTAYQKQGVD